MSGHDVLLLRLDAPLMSFGGPAVDNVGVTQEHPTLSMMAGLLGNALGYHHRDAERLGRLQIRLRVATRQDRAGERLMDFQTVDLGQRHLAAGGWTTRGVPEERAGGNAREATHIRYRHYLADCVFTVALALEPSDESPSVQDLARALDEPARPLFIGRKCCLPAAPLLLGQVRASSLLDALCSAAPLAAPRRDASNAFPAWWPAEDGGEGLDSPLVDERDWANQIHTGRRLVRQGRIEVAAAQASTSRGTDHGA